MPMYNMMSNDKNQSKFFVIVKEWLGKIYESLKNGKYLIKIMLFQIFQLTRYRSLICDKAFYQSSYWILASIEFHRIRVSLENEICGDREKWAARKKRPRLRKRKARKRKGGINWANQSDGEDETEELKTHRDATGRALRSRPIHPSSRTYIRTYIRLPAYLFDNAYRLIERDVLRCDGRLPVAPLD